MATIKQCDIKDCGNIEGVSCLFLYAGRETDAAGAGDAAGQAEADGTRIYLETVEVTGWA